MERQHGFECERDRGRAWNILQARPLFSYINSPGPAHERAIYFLMHNTKSSDAQSNHLNKLVADADLALDVLNSARREAFAEYGERTRKLRDLKTQLHLGRSQGASELFDLGAVLSPELTRLLADPTHNL